MTFGVFEKCCPFSSLWEVEVPDINKRWPLPHTRPSAYDCQTLWAYRFDISAQQPPICILFACFVWTCDETKLRHCGLGLTFSWLSNTNVRFKYAHLHHAIAHSQLTPKGGWIAISWHVHLAPLLLPYQRSTQCPHRLMMILLVFLRMVPHSKEFVLCPGSLCKIGYLPAPIWKSNKCETLGVTSSFLSNI